MAEEERLRFEVGGKKYHLRTQNGKLYFEGVFNDESASLIYEIVFDGRYVKAVYSGLIDKYEHELCQLFDVPKNGWIDYYLESVKADQDYEYFIEVMDEMFGVAEDDEERADRLEKQNGDLKHYITRGGFIQDRNGRWCKEGDEVSWAGDTFTLSFIEENACFRLESDEYDMFEMSTDDIELVEPCEPDICKDFNGEE